MDRVAFGSFGPGDARSKDSRPSTWRLSFCVLCQAVRVRATESDTANPKSSGLGIG
jgi:hypothetical protein